MSDTLTSLQRKIGSAADLQAVVRTMKAMAAANITQYERAVVALSDYYHAAQLGLRVCLRQAAAAATRSGPPGLRAYPPRAEPQGRHPYAAVAGVQRPGGR